MQIDKFYDQLAASYDDMTNFEKRLPAVGKLVKSWVDEYQLKSVLDAGCGSGLYAIALAGAGAKTSGSDLSVEMLAKAEKNAGKHGVSVNWLETDFAGLKSKMSDKVDGVVCSGNTLPHLPTTSGLEAAFSDFHNLLTPGGILIVEILNYERILAGKNRIVKIGRADQLQFIRFYDFLPDGIHFNTLLINWENESPVHRLLTTQLQPFLRDDLQAAAGKAGFNKIEFFGSLKREKWDAKTSGNLVLFARK